MRKNERLMVTGIFSDERNPAYEQNDNPAYYENDYATYRNQAGNL